MQRLFDPVLSIGTWDLVPGLLMASLFVLALGWLLGWAVENWLHRRFPDNWGVGTLNDRMRWLTTLVALPFALDVLGVSTIGRAIGWFGRTINAQLFTVGDKSVTPTTVVIVVGVVVLSFQISTVVQRRLGTALTENGVNEEGGVAVGARLAHYGIVLMGIMVGLQTAGIDLSALFAAGAFFAVGLGFAMQTVTQNFVSGIILIVERAIKPGDILELQDQLVRVERMGIRATVVRNLDDIEVIVPNSELVAGIKNLTLSDKAVRVRVPVGVSYDSDMKAVVACLEAAAQGYPNQVPGRPSLVQWKGFGSSSVDFEVSVWTLNPFHRPRVQSEVHKIIWNALKKDGLVIAYPQLDLHLDEQVVSALRARDAA